MPHPKIMLKKKLEENDFTSTDLTREVVKEWLQEHKMQFLNFTKTYSETIDLLISELK